MVFLTVSTENLTLTTVSNNEQHQILLVVFIMFVISFRYLVHTNIIYSTKNLPPRNKLLNTSLHLSSGYYKQLWTLLRCLSRCRSNGSAKKLRKQTNNFHIKISRTTPPGFVNMHTPTGMVAIGCCNFLPPFRVPPVLSLFRDLNLH